MSGSRVVAHTSTGERVALETTEFAMLAVRGNRLTPAELGLLAKELADASDPVTAARLKEQITRGFYGI